MSHTTYGHYALFGNSSHIQLTFRMAFVRSRCSCSRLPRLWDFWQPPTVLEIPIGHQGSIRRLPILTDDMTYTTMAATGGRVRSPLCRTISNQDERCLGVFPVVFWSPCSNFGMRARVRSLYLGRGWSEQQGRQTSVLQSPRTAPSVDHGELNWIRGVKRRLFEESHYLAPSQGAHRCLSPLLFCGWSWGRGLSNTEFGKVGGAHSVCKTGSRTTEYIYLKLHQPSIHCAMNTASYREPASFARHFRRQFAQLILREAAEPPRRKSNSRLEKLTWPKAFRRGSTAPPRHERWPKPTHISPAQSWSGGHGTACPFGSLAR